MGIFDNLTSRFVSDNDEDYDPELDDYEDQDEDEPRGKGFFNRGKRRPDPDEEEEEDEVYDRPQRSNNRTSLRPAGNQGGGRSSGGQVVPMRPNMNSGKSQQVRVIKPSSFDHARQITDTLLARRIVMLNLEGLDVNTAQRIVDFASGSCYALHGNFMRISQYIIVITPEDVDIAGDITGGRPNAVSGILASAAASQGGMNNGMGGMNGMSGAGSAGGMNDGSSNPFVNSTMNMGSAY